MSARTSSAAQADASALRTALVVTGGVLLVVAAALAAAGIATGSAQLPVIADFGGGPGAAPGPGRMQLASVSATPAALVPLVLAGGARLLAASPAGIRRVQPAARGGALGDGWWSALLTAPITVFLVAQLNGVTDVGALVLTYAAASGAVLLCLLADRSFAGAAPGEWPLRFASMLGIVPWGVIALHQVGAGVVGATPSLAVRVLTIAVLVTTAAAFLAVWRARRRSTTTSAVVVIVVGALPPLLLAALTVLTVPR